jgi:CRP-like cAMP-binding protein
MISRADLLRLASTHQRVGFALWYDTLVDASVFREWITNVARRDAPTRLAHLLCEIGLRLEVTGTGERDCFELPVTQDQLADATGMTAVHVNRTLMDLERLGLFTRTVRYVAVQDWQRLAEVGDFSPTYLHLSLPEGY